MSVDISDLTVRATLVSDMAAGAARARADIASIGVETEALNLKTAKVASESGGLGLIDQRLTTVTKSAVDAGSKFQELGNVIFEQATEGAKRLAEALGLVQGSLAAIGVESAVQTTALSTSLQTYLGSASEAATVTSKIQKMALGPMSVSVLGQANSQFLSAGMSEPESLKLLGGVQNIAAAQPGNQGQAVSGISSALNQVIGSDEITGRQLRQFAPYFDVYGMMAKITGAPRQQVREMLDTDAPAIGTNQFLGDIENLSGPILSRYQGAESRFSKSPMGSIDTLIKAIEDQSNNRMGTPLLKALTPMAGDVTGDINKFFDKDWPKIASGMGLLGSALERDVMPGLKEVGKDIGPLVSDFEKLAPIIPPLAGALVNTGAAMLNIGKDIAGVVMPVAGPLLSFVLQLYDHLGPLQDVVGGLIGSFVALAVLAKVKTWISDLIEPVGKLTTGILGLGNAESALAVKTDAATLAERTQGTTMAIGAGEAGVGEALAAGGSAAASGGLLARLGLSGGSLLAKGGTALGIGIVGGMGADALSNFVESHSSSKARGKPWGHDVDVMGHDAATGAALGSVLGPLGAIAGAVGGGIFGTVQDIRHANTDAHNAGLSRTAPITINVDARGNANGQDVANRTGAAVRKELDRAAQERRQRS